MSYVQANPLTSSKQLHLTTERDRNWWTKVTEFPIKVRLTIRGLLRPAILMNYVKLNVWFYGRKHISSGYCIITAQRDRVDESSGVQTTLSLTRIAPDGDIDVALGLFGEQTGSGVNGSDNGLNGLDKYSNLTDGKLQKLPEIQIHTGSLTGREVIIRVDENGVTASSGSGGGGGKDRTQTYWED